MRLHRQRKGPPLAQLAFLLSVLSCHAGSLSIDLPEPKPAVEFFVGGSVQFGPINGFIQTPAGGNPGTSSHERPTFEELGIDNALFYDADLNVRWKRLDFSLGARLLHLDGDGTFSEQLITQNTVYNAGDPFSAHTEFDCYHAGLGYVFSFLDDRLILVPRFEFGLLRFDYELDGPSQQNSRHYDKGTLQPGLNLSYQITPRFRTILDASTSLPLSNVPEITTVAGLVEFSLVSPRHRVRPALFLGVGYERIDYEDNQQLPNHLQVKLGPYVTGGLSLSF